VNYRLFGVNDLLIEPRGPFPAIKTPAKSVAENKLFEISLDRKDKKTLLKASLLTGLNAVRLSQCSGNPCASPIHRAHAILVK